MLDNRRARRRLSSGVCISVASVAALTAPAAEATFPGANGRIVFSREEPVRNDFTDGGRTTLWTVTARTSMVRRLTSVPSRCRRTESWLDSEAAYSPSGRSIAFNHYDNCGRGERSGIYILHADGSRRKLLLRPRYGDAPTDDFGLEFPTWSPDGRRVAFVRKFKPADPFVSQAKVVALTRTTPQAGHRRLTEVHSSIGLPFSPSKISWGPSRMIAFDLNGQLHVIDPDGGAKRHLTEGIAPDWSPGGGWIAFHRSRTVCEEDLPTGRRARAQRPRARVADPPCDIGEAGLSSVYVINSNGHGLRRVAGARGTGGELRDDEKSVPTWSPDGRRLAFIWDSGERSDLYVMAAKGGRMRRLAKDVDELGGLSWQAVARSRKEAAARAKRRDPAGPLHTKTPRHPLPPPSAALADVVSGGSSDRLRAVVGEVDVRGPQSASR